MAVAVAADDAEPTPHAIYEIGPDHQPARHVLWESTLSQADSDAHCAGPSRRDILIVLLTVCIRLLVLHTSGDLCLVHAASQAILLDGLDDLVGVRDGDYWHYQYWVLYHE